MEALIIEEIAEKGDTTVIFVEEKTMTQKLIEKITEEINKKVRAALEIVAQRLTLGRVHHRLETLGRVHHHRPEIQVEVQLMKIDMKGLTQQKVLI